MTTKRKPYVRKMHTNWWRKLEYYRFYMVREATAVASIWFSILLIYGVSALRYSDRWASFVNFLANPIVLLINIVVLLAALLHTFTWFRLTPKAVRISEEKEKLMIKGLWAITIIASIVILAIGFC